MLQDCCILDLSISNYFIIASLCCEKYIYLNNGTMHVFFIYETCDDILVNLCFRVSNNIKTAFNLLTKLTKK